MSNYSARHQLTL